MDYEKFKNINIIGNEYINACFMEINDHGNLILLHDHYQYEKYCKLAKLFWKSLIVISLYFFKVYQLLPKNLRLTELFIKIGYFWLFVLFFWKLE